MNFRRIPLKNYLMVLGFVLIDQIAKIIVFYTFPYNVSIPQNSILSIHTIFNDYGNYMNARWQVGYSQSFYIIINIMMILFLIGSYDSLSIKIKKYDLGKKYDLLWCMLNAGILASIFDKIFWGHTLDFISIKNFVIFDIKDFYYVSGICGLIILLFHSEFLEKYRKEP